ncbi:MAG: porphobilinogen synthase, partial [Glaciecola sp.]
MSQFPLSRPRRLRYTSSIRRLVSESVLTVDDLIYPMFVVEGSEQVEVIESMPDVFRFSIDKLVDEVQELVD